MIEDEKFSFDAVEEEVVTPTKKWMHLSPSEWSTEQVTQYLQFMNLDNLIPPFMDNQIDGNAFLRLDSKSLKNFGVYGDDKAKLKKKIKEMNVLQEKQQRQQQQNSGQFEKKKVQNFFTVPWK